MRHLSRPHDFPGLIIDQRQASRFAPWIDFEAQRLYVWLLDRNVQDQRKGESAIYRRFPLVQKQSGSTGMDGRKWLLLGI
jgi:hypothetical protein